MKYTVLDYLETTANKYPDKIAFADTTTSITWKALVERAKLISTVISKYYEQGKPVPIMIDKSVRTVVFFFATLYS